MSSLPAHFGISEPIHLKPVVCLARYSHSNIHHVFKERFGQLITIGKFCYLYYFIALSYLIPARKLQSY